MCVATHRADVWGDLGDPVARALGGGLTIVPAADNLADSVLAVAGLAQFPLLITTADNCLLTSATIAEIEAEAMRLGVEAGVALARREDVLAAHPEGQRRFYAFSDVAMRILAIRPRSEEHTSELQSLMRISYAVF